MTLSMGKTAESVRGEPGASLPIPVALITSELGGRARSAVCGIPLDAQEEVDLGSERLKLSESCLERGEAVSPHVREDDAPRERVTTLA